MARFLYIGNFSEHSVGEPEIARALERRGHHITRIRNTAPLSKVAQMVEGHDVVLFSKLKSGNSAEARAFVERCQVPTVCWIFDLYFGYHRAPKIEIEAHFAARVVLTTDGGNDVNWKRHKINHYCLRQGIDRDAKPGVPYDIAPVEIIFIGSVSPWAGWTYRSDLLERLKERYGERFRHYGERGDIRHEALNDLIASAKIVIGDTVHSPHYWSNRIYEMLGRHAFLIHPIVEGLEEEFTYYRHFIPYRYGDFDGLFEKIDHFLDRPEERARIAQAGYEHCHADHTYDHRVLRFLEILSHEKIIKEAA